MIDCAVLGLRLLVLPQSAGIWGTISRSVRGQDAVDCEFIKTQHGFEKAN